jgi:hypothetical protein
MTTPTPFVDIAKQEQFSTKCETAKVFTFRKVMQVFVLSMDNMDDVEVRAVFDTKSKALLAAFDLKEMEGVKENLPADELHAFQLGQLSERHDKLWALLENIDYQEDYFYFEVDSGFVEIECFHVQ